MSFKFEIIKKSSHSKARAGILHTPHGPVETPVFMPVGTQATVKSLTPKQLNDDIQASIILSNTYHLSLRPGVDIISSFGGLHSFMNWNKPILTDSGGYQVFSLSKQRKISQEGVYFKSHIDGSKQLFTPKSVIDLQCSFNSDIMMPLDICSPYPCSDKMLQHDLAITHQWEREAREYWENNHNNRWLFAIVQGGMNKFFREESASFLTQLDFPGYALGGLSVGEPPELLAEMISFSASLLPETKPRYAMGIGLPENLEHAIHEGIDMFDCVIPTRLARHGQVFIGSERVNIKKQIFREDHSPIDPNCDCYTCSHFSKAYIRHLFIAKEMLASTLMSIHNIYALIHFVKKIRHSIIHD